MKKLFALVFVTVVAILAMGCIKASANEVRMAYEKMVIVPGQTTEDEMIRSGIVLEKVTKKQSQIYLGDEVFATVTFKKVDGQKVVKKVSLSTEYLGGIFYFRNAPKFDKSGDEIRSLYSQVNTISSSCTSTESTLTAAASDFHVAFHYDLKSSAKKCTSIFFRADGWAIKIDR